MVLHSSSLLEDRKLLAIKIDIILSQRKVILIFVFL